MTRRKVELPLRATIEYLAGRIDRSEYEYWVSSDWLELVRSSLQSGKTVTGISISQGANEEKDALVLSFGTRTAVQAPARPPLRKKAAKEARLPKHAAVTSG